MPDRERPMRWVLSLLLLYVGHLPANELPPLRFAIAESWAMPLVRIENNQPVEGIMFDLMTTLAARVQRRPEFHVLARLRIQAAMERGSVDIRCFVMPSWLGSQSGNFTWSLPLFEQRDWLVARHQETTPAALSDLPSQTIGTVLGYRYATLQSEFDNAHFARDDARNQQQVLEKLQAGRYHYAVSSQMSLDWFNRSQPPGRRLKPVALLEEQALSCYVRNDPEVPTQSILRELLVMKMSGEIERIVQHHTGRRLSDSQIGNAISQ